MKLYQLLFLLGALITPTISISSQHVQKIDRFANSFEVETIELRHWSHQNVELSNREFKTAARIAVELRKLGLNPQTGIAHTGVVVSIGNKIGYYQPLL